MQMFTLDPVYLKKNMIKKYKIELEWELCLYQRDVGKNEIPSFCYFQLTPEISQTES